MHKTQELDDESMDIDKFVLEQQRQMKKMPQNPDYLSTKFTQMDAELDELSKYG